MENPSFFLEGIVRDKNELQDFEGPLSLILMLLSKNKIEIRDLKISEILEQYIEYLEKMQSMDLEIASEFVQMASHLLYIKTKTLLAADEEISELEVLMQSLEQLKCRDVFSALQKVVPELKKASERGMLYFSKRPEPLPKSAKEYEYKHEPADLLKALRAVYSRGIKASEAELREAVPKRIIYSVRDKSEQILRRLGAGSVTLRGLYAECRSRSEIVATFMSILELCSLGSVSITQTEGDYRVDFAGGSISEIMEKIVE